MSRAILTAACLAALLAGCATQGPPRSSASASAAPPAGCVKDTGSRVAPKTGTCVNFGRSWSGDDLRSTGEADVGDALQKLDPAVTIHH